MSAILPYLGILLLILLSAFFSGSELAYASASGTRLRKRAEGGRLSDRLAVRIFDRYEEALISILIGNNLVNIASSALATVIAVGLAGPDGAVLATFIITVLILTFGEIFPKILASRSVMPFTRAVSLPLSAVMIVTWPLVWLFRRALTLVSRLWEKASDDDAVTEDDLEALIDTVEDEGVVDEETADLLQSALDFGDVLAYEIITPRVDMFAIDADDPPEEQKAALLNTHFTRVPVYRDTVDNVIGVINMNKWLYDAVHDGNFAVEPAMREPLFVHRTMPISDVLDLMNREKMHMVIVTDEYGGTAGVLTMEDILEQIVGDIWDEYDEVRPEFESIGEDLYRADGDMRILDLFDELDVDDRNFDDDNATLGGWAVEMLGDYAEVGDSFRYRNLVFTVMEAEDRRVLSLNVRVLPEDETEQED